MSEVNDGSDDGGIGFALLFGPFESAFWIVLPEIHAGPEPIVIVVAVLQMFALGEGGQGSRFIAAMKAEDQAFAKSILGKIDHALRRRSRVSALNMLRKRRTGVQSFFNMPDLMRKSR